MEIARIIANLRTGRSHKSRGWVLEVYQEWLVLASCPRVALSLTLSGGPAGQDRLGTKEAASYQGAC